MFFLITLALCIRHSELDLPSLLCKEKPLEKVCENLASTSEHNAKRLVYVSVCKEGGTVGYLRYISATLILDFKLKK